MWLENEFKYTYIYMENNNTMLIFFPNIIQTIFCITMKIILSNTIVFYVNYIKIYVESLLTLITLLMYIYIHIIVKWKHGNYKEGGNAVQ